MVLIPNELSLNIIKSRKNQELNTLRAVIDMKVFAVDANSFFSKPSIRVITGLETISKIIHPENIVQEMPKNSFL